MQSKRMICLFLGFFFFTLTIGAEQRPAAVWGPAGFGGAGNFLSVHFDPKLNGVVYAASDVAGVLRSTNYGDRWELRGIGLGNYEVSSFAIDPFDSKTLYAGCGAFPESDKAGIYVSRNSGKTWQHLVTTYTNRIAFRRWRTADAIAPDPARRGVLLSGSRDNGIWRSTNKGISWVQVYEAPLTNADSTMEEEEGNEEPPKKPYPAPVSVVMFDAKNADTVYAAFDGAGIIKSTNAGIAGSWETVNSGLPGNATIKYLAIGSNVIYAAAGKYGIYKSTDGGTRWTSVKGNVPVRGENWVSSAAVHPTDANIAYLTLATYDFPSVWKTTNGGASWTAKGNVTYDEKNNPTRSWAADPTLSWYVTLDRKNPNRLYFVDYWAIQRSDDGGETWFDKIAGAQNTCVAQLAVDTDHASGEPDTLYAAHMDAGLLTSTDQGNTWNMIVPQAYGNTAGHYWRIAIARSGSTKYYYAASDPWETSYGQVMRSTDGINWNSVFRPKRPSGEWMGGMMLGLAVDPAKTSTVYITQDGGSVYKSTNNGTSWKRTPGQPGDRSFTYALAVDSSSRVYVGTLYDGIWRSTNGGSSWQHVLSDPSTIYQIVTASNGVYASAGDSNLYRSTDGGNTWQKITNFTYVDDGDEVGDQGQAIAIDPNNANHIVFGRSDNWHPTDRGPGVAESTDGGRTWKTINAGLGQWNVTALAFGSDGALFAGTWCASTWRLP